MKPFLPLMTLASTLFAGCGEEPKYCTEIGCASGISFTILDSYGDPATNASGTITIDGTDYLFDCGNPDESDYFCNEGILFISVESGTTASYSVEMEIESAVGEITLEFEESQPNGEGCEPICYNAAHTIEMMRPIEE